MVYLKKTVALFSALAISLSSVCASAAAQISASTVTVHICPTRNEYKDAYARNLGYESAAAVPSDKQSEVWGNANKAYNKEHGKPHYDSETRKAKNILEFTLSVTEKTENSKAAVCLYSDGALDDIIFFDTTSSTDFSRELDCVKTPDSIKVFLWENNLKPICSSYNVLTKANLEAANEQIVSLIKTGLEEINKQGWYDKGREIINIINECAKDAISQKSEHLLTSEYARSHYSEQLSKAKACYDEMAATNAETHQLTDFQTNVRIIAGGAHSVEFSHLVDYLGLEKWLTDAKAKTS